MTKRLLIIIGLLALSGCQSSQNNESSSLATDGFQKSTCNNCTLEPFYVDGHWVEGR